MSILTNKLIKNLLLDVEKLKTKDGYLNAGFPNYNTLFGRDSLITSWQLLHIDPNIARCTLEILAEHQATEYSDKKDSEPGKILHEFRLSSVSREELPEWDWPYYGAVDSTSLFIIVCHEFIKKTNDLKFLKRIWPVLERAIIWHLENTSKNEYGFITYQTRNKFGLVHQGWKDGMKDHLKIMSPVAIVEEQGYAYKAYRSFVALAKYINKEEEEIVKNAQHHAEELKKNFKKYFWMPEEKYFAIALDGKNKQRKSVSSNVGHLLICDDLLSDEDAMAVKERLFKPDMWTMGGILTLSNKDPDFDPYSYHTGSIWPHDNWFIYAGLNAKEFKKEAKKLKSTILRAYFALGHIPELYTVIKKGGKNKIVPIKYLEEIKKEDFDYEHFRSTHANPLQAWATGTLLYLLTHGKKIKRKRKSILGPIIRLVD